MYSKLIFISAMIGVDYVLKIKINFYIRHDGRGLCTQKIIFISAMMGVDCGLCTQNYYLYPPRWAYTIHF